MVQYGLISATNSSAARVTGMFLTMVTVTVDTIFSPEAMTYWKRTPGSAHADGKPRWSRTLKRPDGCDKCIEIKKNQVYWVMSARGSIFDGRGNIEIQKNDPVEKEAWEGPRAGFHVSLQILFYVFIFLVCENVTRKSNSLENARFRRSK